MLSSTFCHHLCAASSGAVLPAFFNYGRGKESDSDGVVLLPPRRCVVSVSAARALCLWWQLLCCGRGREPNFKSADVILKVSLLPPTAGPSLLKSPVLLELFSLNEPWSVYDTIDGIGVWLFPPTVVEVCQKDHSWGNRTQMAVKHRGEHLSTLDHDLQTR